MIFSAWDKKSNNSKRTGAVHVSDLSHCLRKSVFSRLDTSPPKPNEQSVKSLLVGSAVHLYIQSLLGSEEFEVERQILWRGPSGATVIAHPDLIHKPTGTVIEMKTSTSLSIFKSPYESHLRQLKTYCALIGSSQGILFYIILGKEGGPDGEFFKEYHVRISPREQSLILDKLDKDVLELQRGFKLGPASVRHIYNDIEYINKFTKKNWLCDGGYCPYADKCAVMREREKESSQTRGN
jgi:hypothetical protein